MRFLAKLVQNMSAVLLIDEKCFIMFTVAHVNCPAFGGAVWHFHKKNQCRASTSFFCRKLFTHFVGVNRLYFAIGTLLSPT